MPSHARKGTQREATCSQKAVPSLLWHSSVPRSVLSCRSSHTNCLTFKQKLRVPTSHCHNPHPTPKIDPMWAGSNRHPQGGRRFGPAQIDTPSGGGCRFGPAFSLSIEEMARTTSRSSRMSSGREYKAPYPREFTCPFILKFLAI